MDRAEKEAMIRSMEGGYATPEDFGLMECPKHGYQKVEEEGSFIGFAGGTSYWAKLACGDVWMDESDDVRAAY